MQSHTENSTKRNSFLVIIACVLFYTKEELLKNLLKLISIQFPTDQDSRFDLSRTQLYRI